MLKYCFGANFEKFLGQSAFSFLIQDNLQPQRPRKGPSQSFQKSLF